MADRRTTLKQYFYCMARANSANAAKAETFWGTQAAKLSLALDAA